MCDLSNLEIFYVSCIVLLTPTGGWPVTVPAAATTPAPVVPAAPAAPLPRPLVEPVLDIGYMIV